METVATVISVIALVVPLVGPPLAAWLTPAGGAGVSPGRRLAMFAGVLIGPALAAVAVLNAVWLPTFSGQCGGWLGETAGCTFPEFAVESVFWSVLSIAVPAVAGVVLGLMVLGVRAWRVRRPVS